MKKDVIYFTHDTNARRDPKIIALMADYGRVGYSYFWIIIEMLREQDGIIELNKNNVRAIAFELGITPSETEKFLNDMVNEYQLLSIEDNNIYSKRLNDSIGHLNEIRERKKAAAEKRWAGQHQKSLENADVPKTDAQLQKNDAELQKVDAEDGQKDAKNSIVKNSIVKDSKVKDSKEEDNLGAPPQTQTSIELEISPPTSIKHRIQEYVELNCPNVSKMKDQLTLEQCLKLQNKASPDEICEVLDQMDNKKDLTKKIRKCL